MGQVRAGLMLWSDDEPRDVSGYGAVFMPWTLYERETEWLEQLRMDEADTKLILHVPACYSRDDYSGGPHDILKAELPWLQHPAEGGGVFNGNDRIFDMRSPQSNHHLRKASRGLAKWLSSFPFAPDALFLDCTWDTITWLGCWAPEERSGVDAEWRMGMAYFLSALRFQVRWQFGMDCDLIGNGMCSHRALHSLCYEDFPRTWVGGSDRGLHSMLLGRYGVSWHNGFFGESCVLLPKNSSPGLPGQSVSEDDVVKAVAFARAFCSGSPVVVDNSGVVLDVLREATDD